MKRAWGIRSYVKNNPAPAINIASVHVDAARNAAIGAGAGVMTGLKTCQQPTPQARGACIAGHAASGALIGAQTAYANHALNGGK